jgi:2-keto-4-pentenoate hydratase/2-oxohepta-3-ene-1,7-dioic acid hydratase in catechol pathway
LRLAALAGPYEDIPIDKDAKFLDYEVSTVIYSDQRELAQLYVLIHLFQCELSVIIGKDCKNLSDSDDPFDYVLGYTVGNDVSARFWQAPAQSGGQHAYAKSFDKFAPLGPVLVSTSVIPDPAKLTLKTWVNGEERQSSGIDDLIFDVPALIRFLSKGRTLEKGTVIMTGTPSGVAAFMKPPVWLADGDVVEMEIAGIGRIKNNMVFMQ